MTRHATLAVAGSNLLKPLRTLALTLIFWLQYAFSGPDSEKKDSLSPVMVPLI